MRLNTLESLAKLFAIVADKDNEISAEKYLIVFEGFLQSAVEDKHCEKLRELFAESLNKDRTGKNLKKLSLNSVRIISILENIKNILNNTERLVVLAHLLILTNETSKTKFSDDFFKEATESFEIDINTIVGISEFLSRSFKESIGINDSNLHYAGDGVILFKAFEKNITHNGLDTLAGEVCVISKDSVLTCSTGKNYFYPELLAICNTVKHSRKFKVAVQNLEYKKKSFTLVQKMSMDFESGQLIGVMGNSGSGKTSFLRCLSGYVSDYKGIIGVVCDDSENIKRAFVPQENSFVPKLTVEEHLIERCRFLQIKKDAISKKCNNVLDFVAITNIKNHKVCKTDFTADEVSGGQQKRLAIATELLSEPELLILDEPTSGLSSEDSYEILSRLKRLSMEGKLIVASVHQPDFDLFLMFDKILIFDVGGYPVYFGSPANASDFIREADGRADKQSMFSFLRKPSVVLNILSQNKTILDDDDSLGKKLYKSFRQENIADSTEQLKAFVTFNRLKSANSFFNSLRFGLMVDVKHYWRFVLMLIIPLFSGTVFSFLIRYSQSENYTYFYNPNVPVWILIILTTAVFIGLAGSGHEFIYLRNYIKSRHKISDKRTSYTFAIITKYFLISSIQTLLLVVPAVYIIGNQFHFVSVFLFSYLMCIWGVGIGLLLSYLFKTTLTVYLLIPLIIIPQLVYSGALINFRNFNKIFKTDSELPIAASLVPMRWAAEGLIVEFYTANPYYSKLYNNRCELYNAIYYSDFFIPEVQSIIQKDSLRAVEILNNEQNSVGFISGYKNSAKGLSQLRTQYDYLRSKCLEREDSILHTYKNATAEKLKFSNIAVSSIVNNSGDQRSIIDKGNILIRNYKTTYVFPDKQIKHNLYLLGFKCFGGIALETGFYNLIVLLSLVLLNIFVLLVIVVTSKYRTKRV